MPTKGTPKAEKAKRGRPSKFTQEIADEIARRLCEGEPLAAICRDPKMPGVTTVWEWQKGKPEFSEAIARAREVGFDVIATECLEIADDSSGDVRLVGDGGDEREVCNTEFVQRAKLRIETRLKLLAKWDPKRYGDAVQLKHADANGDRLVVEIVQFGDAA
jgi:hypothetical protein